MTALECAAIGVLTMVLLFGISAAIRPTAEAAVDAAFGVATGFVTIMSMALTVLHGPR